MAVPECPRTDDAILYRLRQLTPSAESAFLTHVAGCAACRLKLAETADTMDLLSYAAPSAHPPADLKGRLMARLASQGVPLPTRAASRRRSPLRWLVAVAAAAALVAGSYALLQAPAMQPLLAGIVYPKAVEQAVMLTGTDQAPGANGQVLVAREGDRTRISLQAQGLPPLKPGEAYQLWLVKDGERVSGGVFVVDKTGSGGVVAWLPPQVQFDSMGVTREPDALGSAPRGPRVLGSST